MYCCTLHSPTPTAVSTSTQEAIFIRTGLPLGFKLPSISGPGSLQILFSSFPPGASPTPPCRVSGILQYDAYHTGACLVTSLVLPSSSERKKHCLTCWHSKSCRSARLSHRLTTCGSQAPCIIPITLPLTFLFWFSLSVVAFSQPPVSPHKCSCIL